MKTGKEILFKWLQDYYKFKEDSVYRDGTIVPTWFDEPAHIGLEGLIDEALREARQEGLDGKKQNTVMRDTGEHGPYWKEFLLKGCIDLPGVAEAFDCDPNERFWKTQWDDVIRIKFGKPTLRAVDPIEVQEFLENKIGINSISQKIHEKHELIISELAGLAEIRSQAPVGDGAYKDPWG